MAISVDSNQLTTTGTAAQLCGPNTNRQTLVIKNNDGANAAWIGGSNVNSTNGHKLAANDSMILTGRGAEMGPYVVDNGTLHVIVSYLEVILS
jgi:hypothetical protein